MPPYLDNPAISHSGSWADGGATAGPSGFTGRRSKRKSLPDPDAISKLLARLRGDPDAAITPTFNDTDTMIDAPEGDEAARAAAIANLRRQSSPVDESEDTPGTYAGPNRAADALIPRAPAPLDVAGMIAEERARLEQEQGPRVKPNPKGAKGFGLAVLKGLIGLGEGYAASGARDVHGALPSMTARMRQKVEDYRTNREDTEPFDEELKRRLADRLGPAQADYAAKRQQYDDSMQRYGIENAQEQQGWARKQAEHQVQVAERGQTLESERYKAQDERERQRIRLEDERVRENNRIAHEDRLEAYRQRLAAEAQRSKDANARGRMQARARVLASQVTDLRSSETPLTKQLAGLESQLSDEMSESFDPESDTYTRDVDAHNKRVEMLKTRVADLNGKIDEIHTRRAALVNAASAEFGDGGGSGADGSSSEFDQITSAYKAGRISREEARQRLQAIGYK